jgi:membrane-bound lytic murein transglycosylase MltF
MNDLSRPSRVLVAAALIALLAASAKAQRQGSASSAPPATIGTAQAAARVTDKWTGDFDGMVERRRIRILTPYNKTHYFIDKGQPRGIVYEAGQKLEEDINKLLKTGVGNKVFVTYVPTSRDQLYQSLVDGRGDIIAAPKTITREREKLVDFTEPTRTKTIDEILVTGPGAAAVKTIDDLSGKVVAVRDRSLYEEGLVAVNETLKKQGKAPIGIRKLPTILEDEDILEMVNAGLVTATIVDDTIAEFWRQVFPDIVLHPAIKVREDDRVAWAVRKGSPKLLEMLNPLIRANREGTLFGNTLTRKYLGSLKYVKNATSEAEMKKFNSLVEIFRKYAKTYNMDFLLMMAQGYQESRLDHTAKSHVGAIGVMQIMPATGKELAVGDIKQLEPNINGGVKYMRKLMDTYFKDDKMDPLNKGLMTFASYNAGPGKIRQLRREAAAQGLDPNVWFNNVERVVADKIGRETCTYVSNIYKYYIAYRLTMDELAEREAAKQSAGGAM